MRGNFSFLAIFVILLFGLPGIEIPELFSLSDDVSNDFVVTTSQREVVAPVTAQEEPVSPTGGVTSENAFPSLPILPVTEPSTLTGRDILVLLSLQRK